MKKVLLLITVLTIILAVFCGCAPVPGEESITVQENTEYQVLLNSGSCFIYTFKDEATDVWYIATSEGITPRLNSDGSLYADKNE